MRNVFPLFLVSILLRLRPGSAGCEVQRARVRGPGKGVDFLLSFCDRKSLATVRRDQIELGDIVLLCGIFFLVVSAVAIDNDDLGGVVTGPGELGQSSFLHSVVAVEPQILTEGALLPVSTLGFDDYGMPVGRNPDCRVVDIIKEFVQCEFRFVGSMGGNRDYSSEHNDCQVSSCHSW